MPEGKRTMPERMLLVETWQSTHEKTCADRWGLVIKILLLGGSAAFSITLGVASWGMNRIYEGQLEQNRFLQQLARAPAPAPALPGAR